MRGKVIKKRREPSEIKRMTVRQVGARRREMVSTI